ncbi:amidohydrolase 2 [Fusarium albosuccineum]|uniref:Amidohydrolase 2 n=1 Tax=Fusarium albosuccineum TaxID=1237068 RepID=A0A8H4L3J7_9HYPO|nr:amidohydrolase 2 [Fusarium albosuccineum]
MVHQVKPVPQGAWDTHHHIFEPDRFPFSAGRHFTPSVATLEDLQKFEASIGVAHVCIAHGLSYGPDCTSLLYYLDQLQGTARGICVIDERNVTDDLLEKYHAAGVRSVRLAFFKAQAMHDLQKQIDLIKATAERLLRWKPNGNGWSIQIQQPILSHWNMTPDGAPLAISQPGWQDLLESMADGNIWVKISAPYRNSRNDPIYDDLERIVKDLVQANPKRVVWGSDWPHTQRHEDRHLRGREDVEPFLKIDNKRWVETLSIWLSEAEWNDLWVNNPRKLYDYEA